MSNKRQRTKADSAAVASAAAKGIDWDKLDYNIGWGNHFATEVLKGALPEGQNSPQVCPYGLYAEQINGTAFTAPRASNGRSWMYRIRPSVIGGKYDEYKNNPLMVGDVSKMKHRPDQFRWGALPHATKDVDFVDGLVTMAGAGDPAAASGMAIHMFACNISMDHKAMYNSDGDFLIVAQEGVLNLHTEMGLLKVSPHEICVIPRGIKFSVGVEGPTRGYILEVYGRHFVIPDLGPIGSNGLANPRDFEYPTAWYEDLDEEFQIVTKYGGEMFSYKRPSTPFDVVAWHGNYSPFKYNLDKFNCMNSVTFDHPDPSIYTVLTCQSDSAGTAIADFVIFPPRWMVMEDSFRPPWYHRNVMTEYMGMVYGCYDAKAEGFVPGGCSLHSATTAHGPDAETFAKASAAKLAPEKFDGGLAFMFETCLMLKLSDFALNAKHRQEDYIDCWQSLPKLFDAENKDVKVPAPGAGAGAGAGAK